MESFVLSPASANQDLIPNLIAVLVPPRDVILTSQSVFSGQH